MIENLDNQIWVVCDITGLGEWQNTNQPTEGHDIVPRETYPPD